MNPKWKGTTMTESFIPDAPLVTPPAIGWHSQLQAQMHGKDDDPDDPDDDDDDDENDDDDPDDDDPDEGKSDEELRAELKLLRVSNAKNKKNSQRNYRRRKELELKVNTPAVKKPADKADKPEVDIDAERETARQAGLAEGENKAKRADLRAALVAKGVDPGNARLLLGQVKFDDLEYDEDDELDTEDAIDDLKIKYPSMFGKVRTAKRVSGDADDKGGKGGKPLSATEKQARALLGK